ncbi:polysaccharide deacetylase family protein [Streptomyces sp. NPDC001663]|uniref:polysaccharide deacetylase family protein n=1 Tax=Streptomyces sp. NPDC001663 TaxID=3364597 RepID=UPI0036A8982B
MRKSTLVPVLALLGSLALTTSCSTDTSSIDSAPAKTGSTPTGGTAEGTDPGGSVNPAKIKGIRIVSDNSDDRSCPWASSYPDVPGASGMTAAMKKYVATRIAGFRGDDGGSAVTCGADSTGASPNGAELNISYSFLVASGDVVGVRLTTLNRPAAGDGLDTRTYWYDGKNGTAESAYALIADGSQDAFVAALQKQLKGKEGADPASLDDTENRTASLDDMAFTADGGLRVDFDRGTVGVPAGGRYTVTFPKATVTPWLSDFGKRVQQQTASPSAGLDLGATSTPSATMPTQTADGDDTTNCAEVKCIALTFDDGPAAPYTATLLTYLAKYDARVTFFTVGQNVAAHPELVRAEVRAGHEVGNHSWNHPDLTRLATGEIRSQLERTSAAIKAATGKEPTLFRPPYGAINGKVRSATTLSPVLWDVDTEDWKYPNASRVAQYVISKAGRNDVVLLHDIHPTSVGAVPEILRTLSARGYHFVTVSHLRATL